MSRSVDYSGWIGRPSLRTRLAVSFGLITSPPPSGFYNLPANRPNRWEGMASNLGSGSYITCLSRYFARLFRTRAALRGTRALFTAPATADALRAGRTGFEHSLFAACITISPHTIPIFGWTGGPVVTFAPPARTGRSQPLYHGILSACMSLSRWQTARSSPRWRCNSFTPYAPVSLRTRASGIFYHVVTSNLSRLTLLAGGEVISNNQPITMQLA